jgi:hypothetical protein
MKKIDFRNIDKISQLFKEAVDKAVEIHRQKGESIAVSDEKGKVKIISAQEIPKFKKHLSK